METLAAESEPLEISRRRSDDHGATRKNRCGPDGKLMNQPILRAYNLLLHMRQKVVLPIESQLPAPWPLRKAAEHSRLEERRSGTLSACSRPTLKSSAPAPSGFIGFDC